MGFIYERRAISILIDHHTNFIMFESVHKIPSPLQTHSHVSVQISAYFKLQANTEVSK